MLKLAKVLLAICLDFSKEGESSLSTKLRTTGYNYALSNGYIFNETGVFLRITRLENEVTQIKSDVTQIKSILERMDERMAEMWHLKDRLHCR